MIITGKYEKDDNFITVYSNNVIYTIARNTVEYGMLKVGDVDKAGHRLTQEEYNECEMACEKSGSFELK